MPESTRREGRKGVRRPHAAAKLFDAALTIGSNESLLQCLYELLGIGLAYLPSQRLEYFAF